MSVFDELNAINVNDRVEEKGGKTKLTYLSWTWAWGELKKRYPDSTYTVYENPDGWNYFTDGKTCWVKTGVTVVDGDWSQEYIEYLPVMDYSNRSITADKVTSYDVNKAIQRSITKAIARHGLGLYIYAGEDLPEDPAAEKAKSSTEAKPKANTDKAKPNTPICQSCGKEIKSVEHDGKPISIKAIIFRSRKDFDKDLCYDCLQFEVKRKQAKDKMNGDQV